jgi:UDP-2,3-diacylglucosamine pyrophosphatase LpxH
MNVTLNKPTQNKKLFIVGDLHGKFEQLFKLIDQYEINNCYLVSVGDIGIGFKSDKRKELRAIEIYNEFFESRNIDFMGIAGNHDARKLYFNGSVNLSNFRLLPDYHVEFINGEKFLFVGGAISIDRKIRKVNFTYWEDELFVLKPEFAVPCDVLITHSAPFWLGEFTKNGILGWCEKDEYLWRDCVKERDELATLFKLAKPKKAYVGHFHTSLTQKHNGCIAKILNELEIIEHR